MSPERKLEAYLKKQCLARKLLTRKVQWIGHNGAPDRVVFGCKGKIVWIELKSLHGKTSMVQELEIGRMTAKGQQVFVARTNEDVDLILDRIQPPGLPKADY
jgi:hypothetical protein